MPIAHRARTLAAGAVVAGAVLLGLFVDGMASVDSRLAAATAPDPPSQSLRVDYRAQDAAPSRENCPRGAERRDRSRQAL